MRVRITTTDTTADSQELNDWGDMIVILMA